MRRETRSETKDGKAKLKKGFTILELLVASLLLGMLMTVLTMIFNQSSISWRVGEASIADLDDVSDGMSSVHDVADNLYFWNDQPYVLTSIWDKQGNLLAGRTEGNRPIVSAVEGTSIYKSKFNSVGSAVKSKLKNPGGWGTEGVGNDQTDGGANTYTVNVMSAGPNKTFNDYDDIWSFPDEFN